MIVYTSPVSQRRIQALERRIDRIKRELVGLEELRPGSLSEQYNVCGVEGCRCKATPPKKHGPYYQLSFSRKGKGTTRFVQRSDVVQVKRQLKNYAKLRSLVDEWIDAGMELCTLRLQEKREGGGK
jgi:hypothetical protein